MSFDNQRRQDEALAWVRRIQDPEFADWEGHMLWLEADPYNASAFDTAALRMDDATHGLAPASPSPGVFAENDNAGAEPATRTNDWRRRAALGFGLAAAASIVAVVTLPSLMSGAAPSVTIATAAGQQRSIALADGTRLALNGDSVIRMDRDDPRIVTVDRGEVFLSVAHDAAHPFSVHAGDAVFQDVGTAFDVIRTAGSTVVAVREGAVMFDPAGAAVRVDGGQSITLAQNSASIRQTDPASVGGWRHGRLSYADATLATVAQDVARSIGLPVTVDPAVGTRRFSGVIVIGADRARMFRSIAAITGVTIRPDGNGWRMASPTR